MARLRTSVVVAGGVADAEALWYDRARWPAFVDGFARVARIDDSWPLPARPLVGLDSRRPRARAGDRHRLRGQERARSLLVEDER